MLKELGILGGLIIISLMVLETGNVFSFPLFLKIALIVVLTAAFGFYVKAPGRPLLILLLLIMFPLATTELGTDSWIVDLMTGEMRKMNLQPGWILVYTALLMTLFRYFAGPLIRLFNPFGLLMLCSAVAAGGLMFLSLSAGMYIFIAATIYGFAKSYFWPTMVGIVGERFPKGGALTLNVTTGVGMIAVGMIGAVFLGFVQDREIETQILGYDRINHSSIYPKYFTSEKSSILGRYNAMDYSIVECAPCEERLVITQSEALAKKAALKSVALLPLIMFVCFLFLFIFFRMNGGYKPEVLDTGKEG
jgi:hypothetical protein